MFSSSRDSGMSDASTSIGDSPFGSDEDFSEQEDKINPGTLEDESDSSADDVYRPHPIWTQDIIVPEQAETVEEDPVLRSKAQEIAEAAALFLQQRGRNICHNMSRPFVSSLSFLYKQAKRRGVTAADVSQKVLRPLVDNTLIANGTGAFRKFVASQIGVDDRCFQVEHADTFCLQNDAATFVSSCGYSSAKYLASSRTGTQDQQLKLLEAQRRRQMENFIYQGLLQLGGMEFFQNLDKEIEVEDAAKKSKGTQLGGQ